MDVTILKKLKIKSMNRCLVIFYISLFIIISCKKDDSKILSYYKNNQKHLEYIGRENVEGYDKIIEYREDGTKEFIYVFIQDLDDTLPYYKSNTGEVTILEQNYTYYLYKYDEKGKTLIFRKRYFRGLQEGTQTMYYPNGNIISELYYLNGELNGSFKTYYYNRNRESSGNYHGDKAMGEHYIYDSITQNIIRYKLFDSTGRLVFIKKYDSSGKLLSVDGDSMSAYK